MSSLTFQEFANGEVEATGKITLLRQGDFCHAVNSTHLGEAKDTSKRQATDSDRGILCLPPLLSHTLGLCPVLAMDLLPSLLTARSMTKRDQEARREGKRGRGTQFWKESGERPSPEAEREAKSR